jgi:antitoxin VapB
LQSDDGDKPDAGSDQSKSMADRHRGITSRDIYFDTILLEARTMQTAKLFVNGRSQAVRLPKPFRFEGLTEVFIERDGDRVILSPTHRPSVERLIAALDLFEVFPERQQPTAPDSREVL